MIMTMQDNIRAAITAAIADTGERKFTPSLEMAFTLKDVDLKNPSNRIQEEVRLPSGRGKDISVAMFATGEMAAKAEAGGIVVIDPASIEDMGGDRKVAKKLAAKHQYFLSEIPHMGTIGRFLGIVLGPRGKMPRPVPPVVDPAGLAENLRDTVVVRSRDKVTFHTAVGTLGQSEDELVANAMAVYSRVISRLDRGNGNLRSIFVKTTMGPSVAIELEA